NKCIARKSDIAEATVKVHIKAILRKIKVNNRTQAAIWAMNNGSLAQAENTDSPPLAPAGSKRRQNPTGAIAGIKQIDPSISPGMIDHDANRDRACLEPRAASEDRVALAPSSIGPCRPFEDLDRKIQQRRR